MFTKRNDFLYDLSNNYYLNNLLANQFWLFAANIEDAQKLNNSDRSARDFLESTVFGIKYDPTDYSFMIHYNKWEQGKVYNQYDDVEDNQNFYAVIESETQSDSYRVFKCISNNRGAPSQVKPQFSPLIQNGIYELSDGYVWKYMSSTPFTTFKKFATNNLFPILRNSQVENVAVNGIFKVIVENPLTNIGYEKISGFISGTDIASGRIVVFLRNVINETRDRTLAFQISNEYVNRSIYIQKTTPGDGIGAISAKIIESGIATNGAPFVVIQQNDNFTISENDLFQIIPTIEINGDGSNAIALPEFEDLRIVSVRILVPGEGYTIASAKIIPPNRFDPENRNRKDIECILRPVISPIDGHGSNSIVELKSRHICLSKQISNKSFTEIPSSGSYNCIGLVKSPLFIENKNAFDNRVKIILDIEPEISISSFLSVGDLVSQRFEGDVIVSGKVHEIDERSYTKILSVSANINTDVIQVTSASGIKTGQLVEPRAGIGNNVFVVSVFGNSIVLSSPLTQTISEGQSINFLTKEIYVSNYIGANRETFSTETPLIISNAINVDINNIEFSDYQQKTGFVLTTSFLDEIERNTDKIEQTKIIIEF